MRWAAMPEAAVHEHRDTGAWKNQVGLAWQVGVEAESYPGAPQCLAQPHLWLGARAFDPGHQPAALGLLRDCLIHWSGA